MPVREQLTGPGARGEVAPVSRSGPTTAFLVAEESAARRVADALLASGTCRNARVALARGAHVVTASS